MTIQPGDLCFDLDGDLVLVLKIDDGKDEIRVMSAVNSGWKWSIWEFEKRKRRGT